MDMTENARLTDFTGGREEDQRPAGEAEAVAGNGGSVAPEVIDTAAYRYPDADGTIDIGVTQVDYTIEGSASDEFPVLHVFGRTPDNETEHVRVREFQPYFYTPTDSLGGQPEAEYDRLTGSEEGYESIRGEPLTKVFGQTPRDVGQLRDQFDHYEADILFPNRLLIDKDITSGIHIPERRNEDGAIDVPHQEITPIDIDIDPRVTTFDIEVDDRYGFPEDGEEQIICLTSHDSYDDQYVVWLHDSVDGESGPDSLPDYEPITDEIDVDVRRFDSEEEMLVGFIEYLNETDGDILTGWNFDDFDAPYFLDRLEQLGGTGDLDPDQLSRVNEVWRSDWQGPNIKGRVVFDLLYAYKKTQFTELDSYRLDSVGEIELGIGKERYPGDIGDLWENDPERLLEYNLRDVELCVELDRKQDIIPFWQEVATFAGCKLEDAPTAGDVVDIYLLHKVHGDFVLPSKGQQETEDFEGGAVFDPITGVREMVSVLDLKSLYPMCMTTINASPETKVGPDYDGEFYKAPNGTRFRKEPAGIIREMVDELLAERDEKKQLRNENDPGSEQYEQYDRQQEAVKVLMNCFTPDTEVLTPDGVQTITDLGVGDEVYSLNPETNEMEVKPVEETHEYPDYRDDLVDIQTSKADFRVTPNHRMLVRKNETNGITWDNYRFVEAGNLDRGNRYEFPHDWSMDHGEPLETVDLTEYVEGEYEVWVRPSVHGHTFAAELGWHPKKVLKSDLGVEGYVFSPEEFENHRQYIESVCETSYIHREPNHKWIPRIYDGDDFLALLAWYITEGSVYTSKEKQFGQHFRRVATSIKLAQNAPAVPDGGENDHAAIGALLDRMEFDYYVNESSYQFTSRLLGETLERLCGGNNFEKRIPDLVWNLNERQKQQFLDTLIAGDGDRQINSWRYTTSSQRLRDDVLKLCAHLGQTASYSQDSGSWRIYVTKNSKNSFGMNRSSSRSEATDGVYCVTVADNNTLLAGRNGKYQFVGNSLYGVTGWERFRLYDKEMGAAVTATGREVIKHTEQAANTMETDVMYGDSVTGDRPIIVRDPDGIFQIIPIETLFELADQTTASEVLVTADGGSVATTSLDKTRGTLDGWDALSVNDDGEAEWQSITQVIRHESDKPAVTLQHKFGESTTTRDHSYITSDGEALSEAAPDEVSEPLRVPTIPDLQSIETVDVYEILRGYEREYEDGRGTGGTTIKTKRVHANDEYVWFGHGHYCDLDGTVKVQRYIDIGSEDSRALLRLLGAYVTEGSASTIKTTESKFGASIAESGEEWLEQLQEDYYRLFDNATASINTSDSNDERSVKYRNNSGDSSLTYNDRALKFQMMNELSAVFFRKFAGQTSHGKRIPSFVFHIPSSQQRVFLDTAIEGDGSRKFRRYSESYAERNFDFETTSREFAAGLSILLTQRGQKHSLKYRDSKDSYTIRTCDYYSSGREPILTEAEHDGYVYDLSVAENENFVDGVGGIVLHNTDSVMLELGQDISKTDAIERSFELEDEINASYDEFARETLNAAQHRFQIEFEKLYRRFFQAGRKKRYAGNIIWKEGKDVDDIDITGFEYKRSDIAPITKEVQQRVIDLIVTSEGEEYRDDVMEYVHEMIQQFQDGEMSVEEIGIPGGIGKRLSNYDTDTAQVRGAKYANKVLGTNFARGSKPKRLYIDKVHPDFFRRMEEEQGLDPHRDEIYGEFKREQDVICIEFADQLPEEFRIDWNKMLDRTLKGPIERVLEAIDISWDEVKTGQQQTGLGEYF
jgi:DNA polymerase I